jgi:hypothetical protein
MLEANDEIDFFMIHYCVGLDIGKGEKKAPPLKVLTLYAKSAI